MTTRPRFKTVPLNTLVLTNQYARRQQIHYTRGAYATHGFIILPRRLCINDNQKQSNMEPLRSPQRAFSCVTTPIDSPLLPFLEASLQICFYQRRQHGIY